MRASPQDSGEAARLRGFAEALVASDSTQYVDDVFSALRAVFPGCVVVAGRGGGVAAPWHGVLSAAVIRAVCEAPDGAACFDMLKDPVWCDDPLVEGGFAAFIGARLGERIGEGAGAVVILGLRPGCFNASDVALVRLAAEFAAPKWNQEGGPRDTAHEREQHLRHVQKMRVVANMASGVAHDFNNLLGGILGYVTHMIDAEEPGPTWREDLRTIRAAAERASHLTRQLLSFSRNRPMERKTIGMNGLVRDTVQMLRYALPKEVEVAYDLDPSIVEVDVDEGEMGQVIVNLCMNAADAMKGRGGAMTLRTYQRSLTAGERELVEGLDASADSCVFVEVVDTGIGMDEQVLEQLFEPFYTTKDAGEGTGLGLSMVYGIVRNHGGDVLVESQVGEGSVFRVLLPPGSGVQEGPVGKPVPQRLRGDERVLVVEDDRIVQEVVERTLTRYGYGVILCRDGEEAVACLADRADEVGVVLMDIVLPRLDGMQAWKAMRKDYPKLPVLLMSGDVDREPYRRFLEEESPEVLEKPFSSGELVFRLRGLIDEWV